MTIPELEEKYFRLIYGDDKYLGKSVYVNGEVSKEYIYGFVDSMMKRKEIVEDLNKQVMEEWQERKTESYLEYYKNRLIQEIRNLQLKKIC